jgi:cyclopropane fatty-acyl-phospholipid synthase-like methyltransferase
LNIIDSIMDMDQSNGWDSIADSFITSRNPVIGVKILEAWTRLLVPGATVLDIGCGFGVPNAEILLNAGFNVFGIDASRTMIHEMRRRFPEIAASCETAETSNFFNMKFDGMIAIGLMFLLPEKNQLTVLKRVSKALNANGRFLFTAPHQVCTWNDVLTKRKSRSLGKDVYARHLSKQGLVLVDEYTDEGDNHYFDFIKNY